MRTSLQKIVNESNKKDAVNYTVDINQKSLKISVDVA